MASNTLDPCAGCDNPCSNYSEILKQIDQGSMIGSVEKHRRHLCIAQPIPPAQWPKDVKDLAGNYIAEIGRVLKKQKDAIGYAVKLTSASVVTTTTSADSLRAADWYLFPDQIQIRDVQFEQIEGIIQRLFVDDQSNIQIREKTRSIEEQLKGNVHLPMLGETIQCERLNGLWLLVCCHYKRDERCGVLGPMLIDTIEKYARESHRTNDVHCLKISHIGGHKFAGNVIVYPTGTWYGRVLPTHIPMIIDAYTSSSDELKGKLQSLYRGHLDTAW